MGILSNKIGRDELKPGDHIYSWRHAYIYAHHGIYVGDGKVIHFTRGAGQEIGTGTVLDRIIFSSSPSHPADNPCPKCGDQSRLDGVISSCIDCFLADGNLYLFEYGVSPAFFLAKARGGTCTLAASDPPEDVLHRASFLLENGFGVYHIFKNNCEDFAVYCKTGLLGFPSISVGRSGQAASLLAAASALVSWPLGFSVVGCGMYCVSRFVYDIGIRRDVTKVPVESLVSRTSLEELEVAADVANKLEVAADVANKLEVAASVANKLEVAASVANKLIVAASVAKVAANVANKLEVAASVANKLEAAASVANKLEVAAYVAKVAANVANKLEIAASVADKLEVAADVAKVAADVANMLEVAADVAKEK